MTFISHTLFFYRTDYPLRPPNAADVYYRQSRPDIYSNLGMVNENGKPWHELRQLLAPPLTNHLTAANYMGQMCLIGDDFVDLIKRNRQESSRELTTVIQLTYLTGLETVCAVALERRLGFMEKDIEFDTQAIMDSIRGYQAASNQAMYEASSFWKYVPKQFSGAFTSLVKHKDNLYNRIGGIVTETINSEEFQASVNDESSKCPRNLKTRSILEQLCKVEALSLQDVKASVVDYITAGVDTIGNTMIFAIGLIAKHPNVQYKLQQEIDQYISFNTQLDYLTPQVIKDMKYLRACIKESFRMYPTASQLARILEVDTEVSGGYVLPKGSVVLCHHRVASLQEENFTNAKEFIPERWLEDQHKDWNLEPSLVVPFGTGKRSCPGKRIAEQEIHVLVVKLFQAFDVQLLDEVEAEFNFLLTPSGPFRLKVTDRNKSQETG
jgi:cytochrome P450